MSLTLLREAASSSRMFSERFSLNCRQEWHSLQGSPSEVGCSQLMLFANMRAVEVLPTPREPQNRYACASLLVATALRRVEQSAFCPTTDEKVVGRYFRADTI